MLAGGVCFIGEFVPFGQDAYFLFIVLMLSCVSSVDVVYLHIRIHFARS